MLGRVRHHGVEAEGLRHVTADFPDGTFVVNDQEIEKVRSFELRGIRGAEYGCSHGESPLYFKVGTLGTGTSEILGNGSLRTGAGRIEDTVLVDRVWVNSVLVDAWQP